MAAFEVMAPTGNPSRLPGTGDNMTSMTDEESIRIDDEKVLEVNRIMASLDFHLYKFLDSPRGPGQFTSLIMYVHGDTEESMFVSFPNRKEAERGTDITIQTEYRDKSRQWASLREFEENVASWMEECRDRS